MPTIHHEPDKRRMDLSTPGPSFSHSPEVIIDIAPYLLGGSSGVQRLTNVIHSDIIGPRTAALLMLPETFERHVPQIPAYKGVSLASVDAVVIKAGVAPDAAPVLPEFVRADGRGLLVFQVDLFRDVMGQLRASLRALLAQPPIAMQFETMPLAGRLIRDGAIPAGVLETTRRRISWQDQRFPIFSGARSVIAPLPSAIVVEHPRWGKLAYTHEKTKAMVQPGGVLQPSCEEQYRRPDGGEIERPDLDDSGRYISRPQNNPRGGLTASAATNDACFCEGAWLAGLTLDLPLEVAVSPRRQNRGEALGTLSYLLTDDERHSSFDAVFRRILQPVLSIVDLKTGAIDTSALGALLQQGGMDTARFRLHKLFMDYGKLLNACHDAGIFWRYPHFGNVKEQCVGGSERLFAKDFTAGLYFKNAPEERQVGYRALDIALAMEHLPQLEPFDDVQGQVRLMQLLAFNPYTSLLMGYFKERLGDPRLYMGFLPEGQTCHPFHMRRILEEGAVTPVHDLTLPEIGLLRDKVREVRSPQPNVPPPAVFTCLDGLCIEQGPPPEIPQAQFEDKLLELMGLGVSWISMSAREGVSGYMPHPDERSLQLFTPHRRDPHFARVVLSLMDAAGRELQRQAPACSKR